MVIILLKSGKTYENHKEVKGSKQDYKSISRGLCLKGQSKSSQGCNGLILMGENLGRVHMRQKFNDATAAVMNCAYSQLP